ncbi:MAG: DUF177 domain-containing protein [Acidobacteriota bacterium]
MLLNLNQIRSARERYEKTYAPEAFAGDPDTFRVAQPVSLGFDIFKDKAHVRLVGTITTTLELPCGRCLEPFTLPIDASFDLRYQPHAANSGEGEREIEEDDLSTAFYEHETIDLGELLREQFYLALPMKPLCGEGCLGLCTLCGVNLNRETCGCTRDWEDPRLAVLRALNKPDLIN